jgi:stage V sporulation protein R
LSLENLIDPWSRFVVRRRESQTDEEPGQIEVPRMRAKDYMEEFINPSEYIEEQKKKLEAERDKDRGRFPAQREQDVLAFLLENAPLERWERDILSIVREEAYYFLPQMQTKIMNEGWASYWHSRMMTNDVCDWSEIVDYAENNAGVMATSNGRLNPYKLGVELFRSVEERWNKGQFGREWEDCSDLDVKKNWDLRLGLGLEEVFEVRALYNDVTFIDEFFTMDFCREQKYFTFTENRRSGRLEIESRKFKEVKNTLLFALTNAGQPFIEVLNANHENRGELLLWHDHQGVDLRQDYARAVLESLQRMWRRPVQIQSVVEEKPTLLKYDGKEHSAK